MGSRALDPLERAVHDHPSERLSRTQSLLAVDRLVWSSPPSFARRRELRTQPLARLILLLLGLAAGCVAQPPPNPAPSSPNVQVPTSSTGAPSPGSTTLPTPSPSPRTLPTTSPSPRTGLESCDEPNIAAVVRALERVAAYAFTATGFVYAEVFTPDPNAAPRTSRTATAFEGAYVAPDRARTHYTRGEVAQGVPETSIAIGRDMWIQTVEGWQHLPGSVQPRDANRLRSLLLDAGPRWESVPPGSSAAAGSVPGSGCLFRARVPLSNRGRGYRETTVRVDPNRALPTALRIVVRDAFDPFRNRHDSDLLYRVRYQPAIRIEPPQRG